MALKRLPCCRSLLGTATVCCCWHCRLQARVTCLFQHDNCHLVVSPRRPNIYITENGVCMPNESNLPKAQALQDDFRLDYYK